MKFLPVVFLRLGSLFGDLLIQLRQLFDFAAAVRFENGELLRQVRDIGLGRFELRGPLLFYGREGGLSFFKVGFLQLCSTRHLEILFAQYLVFAFEQGGFFRDQGTLCGYLVSGTVGAAETDATKGGYPP